MRFEKFESVEDANKPIKWKLKNGIKVNSYVKNITNSALDYAVNYALENNILHISFIKASWNMLEVRFFSHSTWIYSQSSGIFVERLG